MINQRTIADILLVDPPVHNGGTTWLAPEPLNLGYLASSLMDKGLGAEGGM